MDQTHAKLHEMPNSVLIVDDDELVRDQLESIFSPLHEIVTAEDGVDALEVWRKNRAHICAVLFDLNMKRMGGREMLEHMAVDGAPGQVPFFLITGALDTKDEADDAKVLGIIKHLYDLGVMDVIPKPFEPEIIIRRVQTVIELFTRRNYLDKIVRQQMDDLEQKNIKLAEQKDNLKALYGEMVQALATATEFRDAESGEHVKRLKRITRLFLETPLGAEFSEEEKDDIANAAILHDVGKISIPDHILTKPGKLTQEEYKVMQEHTIKGEQILAEMHSLRNQPFYKHACMIARSHHERWDGRGYPDRLRGDEIPLSAQIVSLADVYDALVSTRVYKPPFSHEQTLEMINSGQCGIFNPELLKYFMDIAPQIKELYQEQAEEAAGVTV